ncbi:MAG: RagB/SusD family nutrient uptake outer membrane protein, partial [Sphingobacteriales bacterium]
MKSTHKIIIAAFLSVGALITSCQRLDIPPTNIVGGDVIFGSSAGVLTYLGERYRKLPIEDFKYRPDGSGDPRGFKNGGNDWENFYNSASVTGEEVGPFGGFDIGNGFEYWPYDDIRAVNVMFQELPKYAGQLTQPETDKLIAEAHFIRAYYYYGMAKRYGGVPIIIVPQDPASPIAELQVHRNKEEEVWDFISAELDLAIAGLPETNEKGRASKYAAAALKSRVMLYAACVAKYGSENFVEGQARSEGFVGIPANKAQGYFQQAWDAAKLLEGKFNLYNANPDKEQNYVDLFLKADGNPEVIFIKQYSIATNTAHSWDATMSPRYFTANALSRSYPTLETVERWGALNVTNPDGSPKRYTTRADVQAGLEPRLLASIYFPGDVLRGKEFDMQRGIYPSFSGTAAAEVEKPAGNRSVVLAGGTDVLYQGKQVIGFT